jgi:Ser/Thr protein kinase RdoA (MazF antagonist)
MPDFSPLYSTPTLPSVERFIDSRYDLGAPVSCRLLQRGFNDVYWVTTTSGDRFVFRLSQHRARGPADVRSETAFLCHLAEKGVPVAAPIRARNGAFFLEGDAPEGRREAVLFEALDGRDVDAANAGDAAANGKTLALLHTAAETFEPDAPLYRLDLDHLLHRPLARIRDSGLVEDAEVMRDLEAIAARTATAIAAFDGMTPTYCHGDCHGFNARINEAGQAVFFDFDDSGPGWLAYDLSVFLWAKISFGRDLVDMWHAFLRGYRTVRPITEQDLEAALHFVVVRHFWLMGEFAARASEWGGNSVGWVAREGSFLINCESEEWRQRMR